MVTELRPYLRKSRMSMRYMDYIGDKVFSDIIFIYLENNTFSLLVSNN